MGLGARVTPNAGASSVKDLHLGLNGVSIAQGGLGNVGGSLGTTLNSLSSNQAPPQQTKSNPSKRHRERLNAELDTLASLLPFDQSVLSKLDKLSILRLSVSYLRTKSYFQASQSLSGLHQSKTRDMMYIESLVEGDLILQQALNGFLLILTCDGEVFFASHTVETYLGFHQSDICHQSVFELVHSEDRDDLLRYLMWNSQLPADRANISVQHMLQSPELHRHLERNFTVRFRCLLDNTSGFLRLDIQGRIKVLLGQNHKTEDPPLALFAVCTPFGPPSLLEMPQKESMFKSKHKLDLSLVSMDARGKQLLNYTDQDIANFGGYDLVHHDDLEYVASAHQELLKTGASGLIAYRLSAKDGSWQWLQTSTRLVYKNSKPDFILCTHRPLMEEEGRDLLGKRTMDFKVTYLDTGLNQLLSGSISSPDTPPLSQDNTTRLESEKPRRKYKKESQSMQVAKKRIKTAISPDVCTGMQLPPAPAYHLPTVDPSEPAYNSVYPTYTHPELSSYPQNFLFDNSRPFHLAAPEFLHYRHHLGGYYPSEYSQYSPFTGTYEHAKDTLEQKYESTTGTTTVPYNSSLLVQTGAHPHLPLLPAAAEPIRVKSPASPLLDSRQSVLMWGRGAGMGAHQLNGGPQPVGVYGVMDNSVELPPPAYTADMVSSEATTGWHHQEVAAPWRPHLPAALG
ncbi:aryl hydrocarbon receptor [Galendromus occidentalis]|uniref:Aryl hydrocarbon receptor n=1 Tax=Galendromus occidentalis TaxID=34638 RepID=A0AAJ7SJE4_9ACAR|nr:aryl hydrocarbon receptor [Galendromus occidentalis]